MSMQENIKSAIQNLVDDFKQNPDKYITESDVRCFLFSALMKIDEFSKLEDTSDGSKSISVHTEVRWYGNSGKLKWRSDIVILDVASLKVKNRVIKLPSKGYSFNKPKAIIEIKLRRINGESDNSFIGKIKEDVNKLKKIKDEINENFVSFVLILDKKKDIKSLIDKLNSHSSDLAIVYQTASPRRR